MGETESMENSQEDGVTDIIENTEYLNDKSSNMKEVKIKDIKSEDVEHLDVITCKFEISKRHLIVKLGAWKEARKETVKSLRELADYLDNVGSLANVVVAVRGNVLNRGIAVGGGIITFAFGMSIPFLIAGAGIGLASFISRVVGVGGGLTGTWTLVICIFCYSTYIAAQFYPEFYTLLPTAFILGMGAAPMWSAKCTYLTQVAHRFAGLDGSDPEHF